MYLCLSNYADSPYDKESLFHTSENIVKNWLVCLNSNGEVLSFAKMDAPGKHVFTCDFDDTGDRAIVVQTTTDNAKVAASSHIFVLGRSKTRTILKLHKTYQSVQSVMVDDYINNGTEQILVLCKEKNVSYRLDTPLVTLVKSFILSSVSWECCKNAVDSFLLQ